MDRDTIFLYVIAVIALCFGLINCIQFFLKGNKTAETVGTIISFKTINPENSKFRNSKWATVSYKVNGRTYQSQNCIQVPMASQIGTTVTVRYDTQNPEKLYSFSILRIWIPSSFRTIPVSSEHKLYAPSCASDAIPTCRKYARTRPCQLRRNMLSRPSPYCSQEQPQDSANAPHEPCQ